MRSLGQVSEALALADDTLTRMRRKLGDHHPQALGCAVGLANCHGDSGEHELAEALLCETIVLLPGRNRAASILTSWSAKLISLLPGTRRGATRMPKNS